MICISPLCAISCLTHIYSVYITLNTTLTLYHIYILYLVTTLRDVFVSWGQAVGPRQAWRTVITNLQLQETIRGERVPIGFETQLPSLWIFWSRCKRYFYGFQKYKSRRDFRVWCWPYPQLRLSEYWPFIVTWRRVWDPARRERNLYSIRKKAGRSSKCSSNSKLPVWSTWTPRPSMWSFEWLISLKVILYTRLHIVNGYDASRIFWLQNQQNRMNGFDCKFWLALPKKRTFFEMKI